MAQKHIWEKEYQRQTLLSPTDNPQKDTSNFFKYLRKKYHQQLEDNLRVLDLGSGNGRNANHLASMGANISGIEISQTAIRMAREAARIKQVTVDYIQQSFGERFPFDDNTFDIIIDVTSSNSLNEQERETYLAELHRTLKPQGFLFLKTLCLDRDKNAKNLLKQSPGPEPHTYIMKEIHLTEKVFTRQEIIDLYSPHFTILELTKKESYTRMNNKSYKRFFWLGYFQHKI